jgi:hypothetical protein
MNTKNMPARLAFLLVAALALLLTSPAEVRAQSTVVGSGAGSLGESGSRSGTAGAAELLVPLTARYTALGGAATGGVEGMSGLEASYANPAGLAGDTGTNVIFSRMDYVADIGVNHIGFSQQLGNNHIAFTVTSWDFGDIPEQTELTPDLSNITFNVSYVTTGLTFARTLTDRISVGAGLKLVSESIDDVSAGAVAFDAGMNYLVGESGLRFGVSLKNIGSTLSYSGAGMVRFATLPGQDPTANANALVLEGAETQLPTLLNFGMSYTRPVGVGSSVSLLGNFRSNSFDPDQFAGALEFNFRDTFFVRGGYQAFSESNASMYTGLSFGAGINVGMSGGRHLTIDYAYVPTDYFSNVSYVTATLGL